MKKTMTKMLVLVLGMGGVALGGDIIYVDDDAASGGGGTSWADAYNLLQDGLDDAVSGDEIWVAAGIYWPDLGVGLTVGDRYAAFQLKNGVALYGGFPTGGTWNQRDPQAYETILSGDLNGDDDSGGDNSENSYHIFYHPSSTNLDTTAILDGFAITGGNADGYWPHLVGGGMFNRDSSPTVTNCTFTGNSAGDGGGMYNHTFSNPTLSNCTFSGNSVNHYGGGMRNSYSSPTVTNCTFSGNSANYGSGMSNLFYSSPIVTNCTFSGNSATSAHGGGGMYNQGSSPTLTNCIFWGDTAPTAPEISNSSSTPTVTYSDIAGSGGSGAGWDNDLGDDGGGNIDADPLFVSTYNLHLQETSPCIDAGDNSAVTEATDLAGNPRIINGTVDMGAYENQYTPPVQYQLTTSVAGGQGSISPASGPQSDGAIVDLQASPGPGWQVKLWTGADNVPAVSSETNTVTMTGPKTVTVTFEPIPVSLTTAVVGHGQIDPTSGTYD